MSGGKLTGTTEMCTVLLPGCRDEATSNFLGLSRAALWFCPVMCLLSPANHSAPAWPGLRQLAFTLFGLAGLQNQADRQTDRSNGYGSRLQMLETPDISLLVGAGY
ncbi:hypothetical protein ABVT39_022158 [Epinephelus coioides]